MCFTVAQSITAQQAAQRYGVDPAALPPVQGGVVSGFDHPTLLLATEPGVLARLSWGLVPHWVKSHEQAKQLRNKTLNARAESLLERPAYRDRVLQGRALLPVNSFYEYHHNDDGSKRRYEITPKNEALFSLGALWSCWVGPESGRSFYTFTVITTAANPLMAEVHNSKQRMPLIVPPEETALWFAAATAAEVQTLLRPFDAQEMVATATR